VSLIDQSKVVLGGQTDEAELRISPTVMFNVTAEDSIMHEETFGPVLSFVSVHSHQEAIDFIVDRPKPLALYVFSKDNGHFEAFKNFTSSGGFGFNEVMVQAALDCNPFGGVGDSGVGSYHGKFSFDTFSHSRSVVKAGFFGDALLAMRYPPYTETNRKLLEFMTGPINLSFLRLFFNPVVMIFISVALGYYLKGKIFSVFGGSCLER
jgi:aldehyde dehydrogenase (NAD+)